MQDTELSFSELDAVLSYDAESGTFTWKVSTGSRSKAGSRAGVAQRMSNGKYYHTVTYKGRKISGAQLAWLLHYKVAPDRSVFYIDENPLNLRIENLRLAERKSDRVVGDDGVTRYKMPHDQQRHYGLKRFYGMTVHEYAEKYAAQNGVCAICESVETAKFGDKVKELCVDHDHSTGAIRDLLCHACNHLLGHAKENRNTLLAAIRYLDKHSAPNVVSLKSGTN